MTWMVETQRDLTPSKASAMYRASGLISSRPAFQRQYRPRTASRLSDCELHKFS
jgi:hypothetical protein